MAHTLVIFGASGDLTRRKLIPALYSLHRKKRLPDGMHIVGVSRRKYSSDEWRGMLADAVPNFSREEFDKDVWAEFSKLVHYVPGDVNNLDDLRRLGETVTEMESGPASRVYYLSTKPDLYGPIVRNLGAVGMADQSAGSRRVVIEKPIGTDLASARELNQSVHAVFDESQIYRIDHYLGKETVQNLLVLRFANSIFEPIWNRNYIDHVQITVAESVTVGTRGGYYDSAGVLRDMFQNHLLQLMMILAMETPAHYMPKFVRDEKVKVLEAVRPLRGGDFANHTVRGQYAGYLQEEGVPGNSQTATFAAVRLLIDNWRWHGVPFYLRSGKNMSCRTTQLVVQFRKPPHSLFSLSDDGVIEGNRLVIQVQPAEGIQLHLQTKVPDQGMKVRETDLDFRFSQFKDSMPDAYQRLLLDAINGDASLFARSDEVELAWKIIDPIIAAWNSPAAPPLESYADGDWGPASCQKWMRDEGREWFDVCPVLS